MEMYLQPSMNLLIPSIILPSLGILNEFLLTTGLSPIHPILVLHVIAGFQPGQLLNHNLCLKWCPHCRKSASNILLELGLTLCIRSKPFCNFRAYLMALSGLVLLPPH